MMGSYDHVMMNSNDYPRAVKFYSWLMPKLGFPKIVTYDKPSLLTGWFNEQASFWLQPADNKYEEDLFHKARVGLREIAFKADTRELVDEVFREVPANGGKIVDPPQEYSYMPGYYAVYFCDPDGVKLEVVCCPRK